MKEADEAACMFRPIIYNGIEYKRIRQTGYTYDERKGRIGFVQLVDKNNNSWVDAPPELVQLKEF